MFGAQPEQLYWKWQNICLRCHHVTWQTSAEQREHCQSQEPSAISCEIFPRQMPEVYCSHYLDSIIQFLCCSLKPGSARHILSSYYRSHDLISQCDGEDCITKVTMICHDIDNIESHQSHRLEMFDSCSVFLATSDVKKRIHRIWTQRAL